MQRQTAVTAYISNEQLMSCVFVSTSHYSCITAAYFHLIQCDTGNFSQFEYVEVNIKEVKEVNIKMI